MRRKTQPGRLFAEKITDAYLALMLSVFLLWPGIDGYTKITAVKYRLFLILTLACCAAVALVYLELLMIRQCRPNSLMRP